MGVRDSDRTRVTSIEDAPIGGGGLMAGVTLAAKALKPTIRLFAAEPLGADDAASSKASGTLIPQTAPDTIADGLLTSMG